MQTGISVINRLQAGVSVSAAGLGHYEENDRAFWHFIPSQ